jgi:hypothetical protein
MPRQKPYPTRKAHRAHKKGVAPRTRALVLLDTAAIRKRAARECEQARKKYEAAAAEWERYQTSDTTEFARALALHAGPLREELRVLLPKFEELASLLDEIDSEMVLSGDSPAECLARIEALDADIDAELDALEDEFGDGASEESADEELEEEVWKEVLEEAGLSEEDWDGDEAETDEEADFDDFLRHMLGMPPQKRKARQEGSERADRIKALYRELVRELHPDGGGKVTPERMRLWHEVQDAYRSGDLARLEFLHAKNGQMTGEVTAATPVSRLKALATLFKQSLRSLASRLSEARRDLAWGFSTLTEKERGGKLRAAEAEIRADVDDVKAKVRRMEQQLEEIRNPKKQAKRGKGGKRRSRDSFFDDDLFGGDIWCARG